MKNNGWFVKRLFKIQKNGAFLFGISFFVLKSCYDKKIPLQI